VVATLNDHQPNRFRDLIEHPHFHDRVLFFCLGLVVGVVLKVLL